MSVLCFSACFIHTSELTLAGVLQSPMAHQERGDPVKDATGFLPGLASHSFLRSGFVLLKTFDPDSEPPQLHLIIEECVSEAI